MHIFMTEMTDADWMQKALGEAQLAAAQGEVPIGAVLVREGTLIAAAHNTREADQSPLEHAEIRVLRAGAKLLNNWRLIDCTLYVTLEPCPMCLGALFQARVGRVVFGAFDDKRLQDAAHLYLPSLKQRLFEAAPASELSLQSNNHTLCISGGILENDCAQILKDFFARRRIGSS